MISTKTYQTAIAETNAQVSERVNRFRTCQFPLFRHVGRACSGFNRQTVLRIQLSNRRPRHVLFGSAWLKLRGQVRPKNLIRCRRYSGFCVRSTKPGGTFGKVDFQLQIDTGFNHVQLHQRQGHKILILWNCFIPCHILCENPKNPDSNRMITAKTETVY